MKAWDAAWPCDPGVLQGGRLCNIRRPSAEKRLAERFTSESGNPGF